MFRDFIFSKVSIHFIILLFYFNSAINLPPEFSICYKMCYKNTVTNNHVSNKIIQYNNILALAVSCYPAGVNTLLP